MAHTAPHETWQYWQTAGQTAAAVETGTVCGQDVALPPHFHEEDQLVVVLRGRRRLVLGKDTLSAAAGETLWVPAGVVHHSLAETEPLLCINAYLPSGAYDPVALRTELSAAWHAGRLADRQAVEALLVRHKLAAPCPAPQAPPQQNLQWLQIAPTDSVTASAQAHGLSREHYTRQFTRQHGVSPQQHRLLQRLNLARQQLRAGAAIAEVALDAGFTDQSHLGRMFKRVFGTSPGRYLSR